MEEQRHSFKANQTDKVSLTVCNVGYEQCKSLHSWGSGVRDHYLIHHIISGKGTFKTPDKTYYLKAGDTFLIYPYTEITYTADKDEPWEYYWTGFNGADASALLKQTDFSRHSPVISTNFGNILRDSMKAIYMLSGRENASIVKMTGQLYITLGVLIEYSSHKSFPPNTPSEYVNKAKRFISINYPLDIGVEQISEYTGISRATLYRAFIDCTGISPVQYLTEFRIEQACKLLAETDLPLSTVSRSAGYEDSLYFSRVFHKEKGVSPSSYRKSLKNTTQKKPQN